VKNLTIMKVVYWVDVSDSSGAGLPGCWLTWVPAYLGAGLPGCRLTWVPLSSCLFYHVLFTCCNVRMSWCRPGCLQILEILEMYWNLKSLLEVLEIS